MKNSWKQMSRKEWIKNIILYAIGVVFMPLGVVLTINAHLGSGGYDALNFALGETLHVNTSIAIYGTAILALLVTAWVRKGFPRITTFISSFFLGIFTDIWKAVLEPIQGTSLLSGLVIMLAGLVVIAFAVACYMISIFPTNPTDDLVLALTERGIRIGVAKVSLDVFCVAAAWLLGGEIGVGTIVCTFCLGPVIDVFHGMITRALGKQEMAG